MESKQAQLTENPSWLKKVGGKKFFATAFIDFLYLGYSIATFAVADSASMWEFLHYTWTGMLIFNAAYAGFEIADKYLQAKK